jgi:pseudouridine-5'-monophosphatase
MCGKPEPDIFLVAAREILGRDVGPADAANVTASQLAERRKGLVFEDALPGMQAGKRAGMSGTSSLNFLIYFSIGVLSPLV